MTVYTFNDDDSWLECRKSYISATQMAAVCGLDVYTSPNQVFKVKHGLLKDTFEPSGNTKIGHIFEPIVIQATNEILGRTFHPFCVAPSKKFIVDEALKIGATPDAVDMYSLDLLECKSTKPCKLMGWQDFPNINYLVQLFVQMMVTKSDRGYLSILGTDLTQYYRTSDIVWPAIIFSLTYNTDVASLISEAANKFWNHKGKTLYRDKNLAKELEMRLVLCTTKLY